MQKQREMYANVFRDTQWLTSSRRHQDPHIHPKRCIDARGDMWPPIQPLKHDVARTPRRPNPIVHLPAPPTSLLARDGARLALAQRPTRAHARRPLNPLEAAQEAWPALVREDIRLSVTWRPASVGEDEEEPEAKRSRDPQDYIRSRLLRSAE